MRRAQCIYELYKHMGGGLHYIPVLTVYPVLRDDDPPRRALNLQ